MDKLAALRSILAGLPGAVVAFSGGVDSTLLAVLAHQTLGARALAVTAVSATYPGHQLLEARGIAARYGLRHTIIHTDECDQPAFAANPPDRCYHCKRALFDALRQLAQAEGLGAVLDGANLDDRGDHRPGHRAARELGVRSPLQEAGLTKDEIRRLSRELGLPTWDKPAYACLASRIPYGRPITPEALARIDAGESHLMGLGLREVRLRDHHPVARVEVGRDELETAWSLRREIAAGLHALGYPYAALDLDGFRSGSMNAVLAPGELETGEGV
ncbi:MAG: ATP-dependent sacrificial sulfur transferase LarE [Patescibacteria group bacterium]